MEPLERRPPGRSGGDCDERAPVESVPAYVLAGGRSRRFGSDKARFVIRREPQIVGLARTVATVASPVRVVAREPGAYRDLGLETIADPIPDRGPMGGLLGALEDASPAPWILCVACDLVGVRPRWVRALLAARDPGVVASVYRTDRYHPVLAAYHTDLRREVRRRVVAGRLTMQRLLDEIPAAVLTPPPDFSKLVNLNHPGEVRPPMPRG